MGNNMKFRGEERPSKASSGIQAVSMGIVLVSILLALLTQNILVFIGGFLVAFLIGFIGNFAFHASNAVSKDRPAFTEFEGNIESPSKKVRNHTIEDRLIRLKRIFEDDLITEEEYEEQKKEILDEI